ncbi:sensor histidine kinase [Desulfoscipio geothermicus]|uniref:histidine kinase n=1 Tax=Desulfoscipio geothermicus DSM 3669 TaxID=1121426 RepID=A0A1I6D129_9FIRM|nr:sensor histidine kinase [Desulfoscipio geothermicus]SFQ99204.1 two-component system, NarL family, sensor histidine kinase DegS [Desulfoscipio geothermicus DSM 3669]
MLEASKLDKIINDIIFYIKKSQEQIYDITENTRSEYVHIKEELEKVKLSVTQLIDRVDKLSIREKKARLHLMEVSRNFNRYTENDIKRAYDRAQKMQVELAILRGQEQVLRDKRNDLERSLRRLQDMLGKAENMMSHLGVVFNYLSENMASISSQIEELHKIQQLGISIIKAQEEERKRVAREIHDGPAQLLANIVMRAEYILKLMNVNPGAVKEELTNLQQLVRQSLQDVRKIIFDLRPMVLDDLGLVPALNRYIEDFKNQYKINAELVFFGKQERLPPATEIALFRVVQEALNNVHKHARAGQVLVKMEQLSDKITIRIKDDGRGFDPASIEQSKDRECYGLINMRERVQILKGEFKINSLPGKGTVITLTIPV